MHNPIFSFHCMAFVRFYGSANSYSKGQIGVRRQSGSLLEWIKLDSWLEKMPKVLNVFMCNYV
jgi:hypothetical protein